MATKWKRVLTDADLSNSFGNLGNSDLNQSDTSRKFKLGDNSSLTFEANFVPGDSNTSIPIFEVYNDASNHEIWLGGVEVFVGYRADAAYYKLPPRNTYSSRSFVFAESSKEVKFKSPAELFNPTNGLAYVSGGEVTVPIKSGNNADSLIFYDVSGSRLTTNTIENVVGPKVFSISFGLNAAITPGSANANPGDNEWMRGTNGVQFAQNYGHVLAVPCKLIAGSFTFSKDVDTSATSGVANTRRKFNIWKGTAASNPGAAGDGVFSYSALAASTDFYGQNMAQGSYIAGYENDFNLPFAAGDYVTVGITSYSSTVANNGQTSLHQATLYFRYED